jgi:ring-1,2-phenylacetyl-CoA epoxidase subunit PaaE
LRVREVRPLTEDSVEIAFEVPENLFDAYAFDAGQHLTLRFNADGEEIRRTYSISSTVGDRVPRIGVRRIEQGRASNWLCTKLAAGDALEVMTPAGRFTRTLDPAARRHWLFVAAGSGITPIMSIVSSVLAVERESQVTLLYGNRSVDTIMYRQELDDLKSEHLGRFSLVHILSRERRGSELFTGRISPERVDAICAAMGIDLSTVDHAFVCGPEQMSADVRSALVERGISEEQVHVELYETSGAAAAKPPEPDAKVVCSATVILHGIESPVHVLEGERVLDAARREGLDVPFACTGGVCATCRAHVTDGEVEMLVNHALEPHEVEAGYALTCQALPLTPSLKVDYDRP